MSLTSDLKQTNSYARQFIDAHFPNLSTISRELNRDLKPLGIIDNPHRHKIVSMLVGTAIDYRIRAYLRRNVHRSTMVLKGIEFLQRHPHSEQVEVLVRGTTKWKTVDNPWFLPRKRRVAERLIASFKRFTAKTKLRQSLSPIAEQRMCRYCLLFAYLDFIGRSPYGNSALGRMMLLGQSSINNMLSELDSAIVDDLISMSRLFVAKHQTLLRSARKIVLGRPLTGSADVFGGADFDLIINGCLLDFKASIKPKITTDHLRQLVGYWLLDYNNELCIESVGVVLMRHGQLRHFKIQELLQTNIASNALRDEFARGLKRDKAKRQVEIDNWRAGLR